MKKVEVKAEVEPGTKTVKKHQLEPAIKICRKHREPEREKIVK